MDRRRFILRAALALPAVAAVAPGARAQRGDRLHPVSSWTQEALSLITKYRQNPLRASRVLASTHVAMFESVRAASDASMTTPAQVVALHAAAGRTLAYMYPAETPGRLEAIGYGQATAASGTGTDKDFSPAWGLGRSIAERVMHRMMHDGADATWNVNQRPAAGPGVWRAAPPLEIATPAEPLAGKWKTWVLKSGSEIQPPPPIPYDSPAWHKEVEEVYETSRRLTEREKSIADRWDLDLGTVTPPGVWNLEAQQLLTKQTLSVLDYARILAVMNVAMADAFIACWHAKFTFWTLRPLNAIRDRIDPKFLSHTLTPPFPSYPSGHSTVSGAASTVLAHDFPDARERLEQAAEEAAMSRLYGGIHYRSDNDEGLRLGRRIGGLVFERLVARDHRILGAGADSVSLLR